MAFNKNNNNTVEITSAPSETVISADTKFKGDIDTDKPLTIEGIFEGTIKSTNTIYVAETGEISATIECKAMTMLGKGSGNILCMESLEFGPAGTFVGNVATRDIVMAAGAKLDGQCKIG